MIDAWTELVATGFGWVCLAAWRALPVFAIVLGLSLLLCRKIPARYFCLLWMLVIARLLLPFSIASPASVSSKLDGAIVASFQKEAYEPEYDVFYFKEDSETVAYPVLPAGASTEDHEKAEEYVAKVNAGASMHAAQHSRHSVAEQPSTYDRFSTVVVYLVLWTWFTGVLFMVGRGFIAYTRFAWRLRSQPVLDDQDVIDRTLRAGDALGVSRRPKIKVVTMLDAPAIFGLWRPVLCLPTNWRDQLFGSKLDWVLKHELAHLKRRDSFVLFIAGIARALHWFHPISWIAYSNLQNRIEQAADNVAIRGFSEANVRQYGEMLLQYAASGGRLGSSTPVGLLTVAPSRGLKQRIVALKAESRQRRWLTHVAMLPVIALVACAGLTDARTIEPGSEVSYSATDVPILAAAEASDPLSRPQVASQPEVPAHEVRLDVKGAMRKAKQLQPGINAEKFVLNYFAPASRSEAVVEDGVLRTRATLSQKRLMQDMIGAFERGGAWQIAVECRILHVDVRLLNAFDWHDDPQTVCKRIDAPHAINDVTGWHAGSALDAITSQKIPPRPGVERAVSLPVRATKISQRDGGLLVRRCEIDQRSNIVFAPKFTLFNGQSAIVRDVIQRPFVTDVAMIKGELASALQPKVSVFEDGWTIRIQPEVTDGKTVDLFCAFTESCIGDVRLANLPINAPEDTNTGVTIQVPSIQSTSISVRSRLSPNDVLLVFSPTPYEKHDEAAPAMGQVLMIRTTLLPDHDVLKGFASDRECK